MSTRTLTTAFGWILCASGAASGLAAEPVVQAPDASYRDKLIDGGNLPVEFSADDYAGRDPDGWPRAMSVTGITSRGTRYSIGDDGNGVSYNESGVRLGGMLNTPDYGAFTLDAIVRESNSDDYGSGNMLTLAQRGMPMNGGWYFDNSLGATNTPATDLARRQFRFYVPTIPINGAATEWRLGSQLQFNASFGEPGLFTGIYVPTFEGLGGSTASGGLQFNFSDEWSTAVQMIDAGRVHTGLKNSTPTLSTQSWFGAIGWNTPDATTQFNYVQSTIDGRPDEFGGWADAALRTGRTWHTMGAFYLEQDLVWGNQPLSSDSKGGYYRAAYQSRRWAFDGGVDYFASVTGQGDPTTFGTVYARYQSSSALGFGGGGNLRHSSSDAWSTFGFADAANRWGTGRGQLNYARDDTRDGTQFTLDQSWNTQAGRRLSTALSVGHENLEAYSANTAGLAVNGGGDIVNNLSADLSARWDTSFGDTSTNNWLLNLALNWAFAPGWMASANAYSNRGSGRLPLSVDSPIPGQDPYQRLHSDQSSVYLSIRYDWRAGTPSAPLGGGIGGASGSIVGILYLDSNDNGRRDAGEAGAANVVVVLNGRFQARTNGDGRFEFPSVAVGDHFLAIVPDNLPLAWSFPAGARIDVRVGVRTETRVELGARRQR